MRLLLACMLAHLVVADLLGAPWWVPNLTLVGLVVTVSRTPERWLAAGLLAALIPLVFAARYPGAMVLMYVLIGFGVRLAAAQWNAGDWRVRGLLVMAAAIVLSIGGAWFETSWSWGQTGRVIVHLIVTVLSLPCLLFVTRRLAGAVR